MTTTQHGAMAVVRLEVSNFKGIEYAVLPFAAHTTVIGGKNHQGKSSAIDALLAAIAGKKAFPREPIREGQQQAEITVHLNGATESLPWPCTVSRVITRTDDGDYTTKVTITTDEGVTAPSPQSLLSSLRDAGDVSYDPLGFVRMKPSDQVDVLKRLVGLDVADIDTKYSELYTRRTIVNRDIRDLEGQIKQHPIHNDLPQEPIDVAVLMDELSAIEAVNATIARRQADKASCDRRQAALTQQREELLRKIDEIEDELEATSAATEECIKWLSDNLPVDVGTIRDKMRSSTEINRKISQNEQRLALGEEKARLNNESLALTKELKLLDQERQSRMASVSWPIDGMGFGEDGVVFQGRPFADLSSSEQLEVAVAIDLRRNPNFPLSIVRDGSLLDDESLAELSAIVDRLGGQCLVERVSTGPECQFVFTNGRARKNG